MKLSVDNINRESPYWVLQLDDMTFRFVTKNGVRYRVGFYQDPYFLRDKAYHFFIANEEGVSAPKDVDVFKVITCVIRNMSRCWIPTSHLFNVQLKYIKYPLNDP